MRDRVLLGAVGLLALFGPLLNLVLAPGFEDGAFDTALGRVVNSASYFTNTTNALVGVTFLLLLRDRDRGPRFQAMHLSGVLAAVIVGSVYHLLLADLNDPTGLYVLTNLTTHTLVPILAPLTWLVVGPRGRTDLWTVLGTLAYPLAWLAYAMIRGTLVTGNDGMPYYPYPFLDAADLGYATALVNVAGIAAVFLVLAAVAAVVDRVLDRRPVPA